LETCAFRYGCGRRGLSADAASSRQVIWSLSALQASLSVVVGVMDAHGKEQNCVLIPSTAKYIYLPAPHIVLIYAFLLRFVQQVKFIPISNTISLTK